MEISIHARIRYIQRTGHKVRIRYKIFKCINNSVEVRLKNKYKLEELERIGERGARYFLSDGLVFVVKDRVLVTVLRGDYSKWQPVDLKEID